MNSVQNKHKLINSAVECAKSLEKSIENSKISSETALKMLKDCFGPNSNLRFSFKKYQ